MAERGRTSSGRIAAVEVVIVVVVDAVVDARVGAKAAGWAKFAFGQRRTAAGERFAGQPFVG